MIEVLKTTEKLRKELEKLRREEFDACLNFSHKIKPLEEQLKAAEKEIYYLKMSNYKVN
jgi:hypothetical protein